MKVGAAFRNGNAVADRTGGVTTTQGEFSSDSLADGIVLVGATLVLFIWNALLAGLVSHRREGWRDTRPPLWLVLGAAALATWLILAVATGRVEEGRGLSGIYLVAMIAFMLAVAVATPVAAFLLGRTVIVWLEPRLRVYGYLADYLRVMWVPLGAFAVGYLTIIVLFAGSTARWHDSSPRRFPIRRTESPSGCPFRSTRLSARTS